MIVTGILFGNSTNLIMYMKAINSKIVVLFLICAIFFGCRCKKTETSKDLFEKHYEKNIKVCMDVMTKSGRDSIKARELCSCMLQTAYNIDTSFVFMSGEESVNFFKINYSKIKNICDSTINKTVTNNK